MNGAVSKTVVRLTAYRGFESHPLRHSEADRPSPGGSIGSVSCRSRPGSGVGFATMKKVIAVPLLGILGLFALSGTALTSSGCSNSKPAFCSDVQNLKGSVSELVNIQVNSNTINELQTDFETVQQDADAAIQSARTDFPDETQRLEDSINGTRDAIEGLPSSPTTEQYIALGAQVIALGTAAKDFQEAVSSACN